MSQLKTGSVLILDFGSQYTQLIARRIREKHVYSEIVSPSISMEDVQTKSPKAIILSGGPSSVFAESAPAFDTRILSVLKVPIFGICYGLQLLVHHHQGTVESTGMGEYGCAKINLNHTVGKAATKGMSESSTVWMSHMDRVTQLPLGWKVFAQSSNGVYAGMVNEDGTRVATQFHPEVSHSEEGGQLLDNFLFEIAQCTPNWTPDSFITERVESIRRLVGTDRVLVGVSGGVDSTVVACLLHKARLGDTVSAVMIDHGLLRLDEAAECASLLEAALGLRIHVYDESEVFFKRLTGVTDPEEKRKIIGDQFIRSFDRISGEIGGGDRFTFLGQGTLYPDIIESGVSVGKSAHVIKSHHNVGGLPKDMKFRLIEPLRDLFKDEVRAVGKELGIPEDLVMRHPFPGPGLAIRIMGEITRERVQILQNTDAVYISALKEAGHYDKIWQAFAVLIPVKTVGVMGDQRTYEYLVALRAVTSVDGMTADWYNMPHDLLASISNKIVNQVSGVNRVVYDVTSKPPGTIEWE